jgi:hypothetical protein
MESGGENEVGVWVSGFYGSGKSSFTKYLGLAFDDQRTIDGTPFIKHLQDRLHKPQTKALLGARGAALPGRRGHAGPGQRNARRCHDGRRFHRPLLQGAAVGRLLTQPEGGGLRAHGGEGRPHARAARACREGAARCATWARVQNNPLAIDGLIPKIAHEMYPALFPDAKSFSSSTDGFFQFEDQRVQEMIDIVRAKSGKQNIIFIVDEVGQYVASRDNLILNLDGLAKNLKRLGDGKVWIISTAQQTLTEDDPRAALNSDKLYKLKDRFPIQIDLESSDIKEICYRRLLGKSPAGRQRWAACSMRTARPCGTTPSCRTPSTTTPTSPRELHQSLPVPAGSLRHPAAPAGRTGQVHRRHWPALGDQGDPGRPQG